MFFLTIFSSNETVCFGQCLDKKLDHLNFIPLKKKFSSNSSAKMNLGGGTQKNRSWEQCLTMTDLWVATTRAPSHCLPVEPRIPLGSEGSKTDEAQATRSNANVIGSPQLKSCKTQWFLRNPRAPWKSQVRDCLPAYYLEFNSVILLPLRPASLMHKNPQRRKIIHGMRPVGCKDQSIEHVFVEISHSCNFCGSYYIPLFNNELFLLAFVVLNKRRTMF